MTGSSPRQSENTTLGIIVAELALIVATFLALSLEYRSNHFMQNWVAENAWPLAYLLNGYLAAILAGVTIGSVGIIIRRMIENRRKEGLSLARG